MDRAENITPFPEKSRYKPETAAIFEARMPEDGPDALIALRKAGMDRLRREGLPTSRLERWKYTNMAAAAKGLGGDLGLADLVYKDLNNFVSNLPQHIENAPEWLLEILRADPPGEDRYHDMALWRLADSYLRDGVVVDVPAGKRADSPVEITVKGSDNRFFVPRMIYRLGQGADLTIIEYHTGEGRYWNNSVAQVELGPNARLRHYRIQENSAEAVYSQNTHVRLDRDATYESFTLNLGGGLSRSQIHAELLAENGTCNIYGVNLLKGSQHADITAEVEHKAPHCNSSQFVRSVLDDQAHGVFQGKVYVHEGADKTDGTQLSNAILMSEGAEMDTKPELEIYADDVKCAHGATTGRLEDEPLFYLRSRGIPEKQAHRLLVEAFVGEVVDNLADEAVKVLVSDKVQQWLS